MLTAFRATLGREPFLAGQGPSERFTGLKVGVENVFTEPTADSLEETARYRIDGSAFAGLELAQIDSAYEPLGLTPLRNNVRLAVPSALDSSKSSTPLEERSEKYYAKVQPDPSRDSLVTQLGGTVACFGVPGLMVAALVMAKRTPIAISPRGNRFSRV